MTAMEKLNTCGGRFIGDAGNGEVVVRARATPGATDAPVEPSQARNDISRRLKTAAEGIRIHAILEAMAAWCLDPSEERLNEAMR